MTWRITGLLHNSGKLLKGNPNFQGILNWIIQILHYYCRKQHKNTENTWIIEQNVAISLLFFLLIATCASFAFLNNRVFSVLGHSLERHKWSFVLYIVSFSALKISFSKLSLAKYHCLHKNHTYFMSSVTTKRLYKSLFYKFFCTDLSQVVLRRFYIGRFLCNKICVLLFV